MKCAKTLLMVSLAALEVSAQALSDNIVIDQFGYRENAKKTAVIRVPYNCTMVKVGDDKRLNCTGPASSYEPGATFRVIDESTNSAVHSGAPVSFRNGIIDSASGDKIWHFDFSSVTTPGRYHIVDADKNVRSFSFNIANDVYDDVLKAAIKMFYYQRAGTDKPARYAGADWEDEMCFEQDKRSRLFTDKDNANTERDMSGGWFDAGDFNKYTKWTADYISTMLLMYEENPNAFKDDYGIPESGNGIPDILDEAMWGLTWLLKMQNDSGAMYSVQGLAGGSPPSSVKEPSYYGAPNATATFGAVATFAIASRIFGERGETAYAEQLKTAALRAWAWGSKYPDSLFFNNSDKNGTSGLAAGQQENDSFDPVDGRLENHLTAAWYLYELTGTDDLKKFVEDSIVKLPLFAWYGYMDHYRHSSHLLYMRYLQHPNGDPALKDEIRGFMRNGFAGANFYGSHDKDGYRSYLAQYNWGSNKAKADNGELFYKWDIVEPGANYKDIAEDYLHYIHGVNPFNMVYLTSMGGYGASRSAATIFHSWFDENSTKWGRTGNGNPGPAPGFLPGGPNGLYKEYYDCCDKDCAWETAKCNISAELKTRPPAKIYTEEHGAWPLDLWTITEPSNGYQLSYIRLLSKFVSTGSGSSSISPRGQDVRGKTAAARSLVKVRGKTLSISSPDKSDLKVRVIDVRGRTRANFKAASGSGSFSLRKIPAGRYFVEVRGAGGVRQTVPVVVR